MNHWNLGYFYVLLLWILCHFNFIHSQKWNPLSATGSSFFFLCQYGQTNQGIIQSGRNAVQVELSGHPEYYLAGQIYKVLISFDEEFDAFLVTGVYSITGTDTMKTPSFFPGFATHYQRKMCTVLHSNVERHPTRRVTFLWMAPLAEMGCVDFIVTLARDERILVKDNRVYHICPEFRFPIFNLTTLSGIYEEGVLFRDDFESGQLSSMLWNNNQSISITKTCEPITYGYSALFCSSQSKNIKDRAKLTTIPLNVTTASVLQFGLGRTVCNPDTNIKTMEANVTVTYGIFHRDSTCSNWTHLQTIG